MREEGVAANAVTYNILLTAYLDCGETDLALEQYKQLINDAPLNYPSRTTYRLLIKGLLDNQQFEKALEIRDEMETMGFKPDPTIYSYLMLWQAENSNAEGVFEFYEELKQKIESEEILDGVVYGNLMRGYFLKGMETEAMEYKRFSDAIEVFNSMREKRCCPDTLSYRRLIDELCSNDKFAEAEVYMGMGNKKVSLDDHTFVTLMDFCLKENRPDDAAHYYLSMLKANWRPNLAVYDRLVEGLVKGVLEIAARMLREYPDDFNWKVEEFVKEGLRKEGREHELTNLEEHIAWEKAKDEFYYDYDD
ncbi:UNVERIFIED_CONTAM: Pentatricopeptide repeat-containing protein, mitochondrial [Sesamum radiatum]|uniref:Pentatricopeptide repeat-containing protein, mitochondrial n=1 Tax=Sesamum radiatum TaxID=300843 RepID=A0AAW2VNR0_SESRA